MLGFVVYFAKQMQLESKDAIEEIDTTLLKETEELELLRKIKIFQKNHDCSQNYGSI